MRPRNSRFSALYARYGRDVVRMVRRQGVPPEQVDDVVQEVWIVVHQKLQQLETGETFAQWLKSVAGNHLSRLRRYRARHTRRVQAWANERASDGEGTEAPARRREALWTLASLLAFVPEEQRRVLLLCEVEGYSAPEVSKLLGVPLNTVYSRHRLALRRCMALASLLLALLAGTLLVVLAANPRMATRSHDPVHSPDAAADHRVETGGAADSRRRDSSSPLNMSWRPHGTSPAAISERVEDGAAWGRRDVSVTAANGPAPEEAEARALDGRPERGPSSFPGASAESTVIRPSPGTARGLEVWWYQSGPAGATPAAPIRQDEDPARRQEPPGRDASEPSPEGEEPETAGGRIYDGAPPSRRNDYGQLEPTIGPTRPTRVDTDVVDMHFNPDEIEPSSASRHEAVALVDLRSRCSDKAFAGRAREVCDAVRVAVDRCSVMEIDSCETWLWEVRETALEMAERGPAAVRQEASELVAAVTHQLLSISEDEDVARELIAALVELEREID